MTSNPDHEDRPASENETLPTISFTQSHPDAHGVLKSDPVLACACCGKGVSYDFTPWESCYQNAAAVLKCLQFGRIRGMVLIAGCKASSPEDNASFIELALELMKRDFLVTVCGCIAECFEQTSLMSKDSLSEAGVDLAEVCHFLDIAPVINMGGYPLHQDIQNFHHALAQQSGIEFIDLPFAVISSASTCENEEALNQLCDTYGNILGMESDAMETANIIDNFLHDKRLAIGWADRFHCSMETYS